MSACTAWAAKSSGSLLRPKNPQPAAAPAHPCHPLAFAAHIHCTYIEQRCSDRSVCRIAKTNAQLACIINCPPELKPAFLAICASWPVACMPCFCGPGKAHARVQTNSRQWGGGAAGAWLAKGARRRCAAPRRRRAAEAPAQPSLPPSPPPPPPHLAAVRAVALAAAARAAPVPRRIGRLHSLLVPVSEAPGGGREGGKEGGKGGQQGPRVTHKHRNRCTQLPAAGGKGRRGGGGTRQVGTTEGPPPTPPPARISWRGGEQRRRRAAPPRTLGRSRGCRRCTWPWSPQSSGGTGGTWCLSRCRTRARPAGHIRRGITASWQLPPQARWVTGWRAAERRRAAAPHGRNDAGLGNAAPLKRAPPACGHPSAARCSAVDALQHPPPSTHLHAHARVVVAALLGGGSTLGLLAGGHGADIGCAEPERRSAAACVCSCQKYTEMKRWQWRRLACIYCAAAAPAVAAPAACSGRRPTTAWRPGS